MKTKLPLYLALLLLTQCSKCKDDPTPADQLRLLPPATQTGRNTFGCLVNGQAYTPQGNNGQSNNVCLYDPGPNGANLSIRTYRSVDGSRTSITVNALYITGAGTYSLDLPTTAGTAYFNDRNRPSPCNEYWHGGTLTYSKGNLTLTRVDEQAGIISGTFEFTLAQPGCDTIKVTQGRFDYQL
ncbi:DUF6252 family protein [Hymenobacter saemangeumensis]